MTASSTLLTAEQFAAIPDDGNRRELIQGEPQAVSPAGFAHGVVIGNLLSMLGPHVLKKRLGRLVGAETGFLLSRNPDTVCAPDVGFVTQQRIAQVGAPDGFWPGAPDLAIEVVSPHDAVGALHAKVRCWLEAGAQEVWIVSPALGTVTIFGSLTEATTYAGPQRIERSGVLGEIDCPLPDVFAGLSG